MTKNELASKTAKLRGKIELASSTMSDKDASTAPELFGGMKYDGTLIKAGTRIRWGDVVKKAAVDLWDNEASNPNNAPTLWADLEYRDGIRIIPEVITVTKAFSANELGWWGDVLCRSRVNNNIYTPAQFAPNWDLVNGGEG